MKARVMEASATSEVRGRAYRGHGSYGLGECTVRLGEHMTRLVRLGHGWRGIDAASEQGGFGLIEING